MMSPKEGVRSLTRFMSFIPDRGDQPGPPSLEEGGHEQVPTASINFRTKDEYNTLVGDVSMLCYGKVNPIRGGGRDDAVMSTNEHRPRVVCHLFFV